MALWSLRFNNLDAVFWWAQRRAESGYLGEANGPSVDALNTFFSRTARSVDERLDDQVLGGPLSILPFRDRPFLRFRDGSVAPIHPSLVVEKLTHDFFWWAATPGMRQVQPWQRDWGDLVELYAVRLLAWIAAQTGCDFAADLRWNEGQVDAVMSHRGHVALFEISAASLTDAAAYGGDWRALEEGLV